MYKLVSENNNITTIQLMTELNNFYNNSNNWSVVSFRDILGADPLRGKELFIERDGKHYSMISSIYEYVNARDIEILETPQDGTGYTGTGHFTVYLNTSYNDTSTSYNQQSNQPSTVDNNSRYAGCCIPKNNNFNYRLFTTYDEYDFILEITFDIYRFFVFWGDACKGQLDTRNNPSGQYSLGHFSDYIENLRTAVQTDLYNDIENISARRLQKNPFYLLTDGDCRLKGNLFYYDINNELLTFNDIDYGTTTNCGRDNMAFLMYSQGLINSLSDDFFGNELFVKFKINVEKDTSVTRGEMIQFKEFDFGFCSDFGFNDGDIIELKNGLKLEILKFLRTDEDIKIESPFTRGMAMFIIRGDL